MLILKGFGTSGLKIGAPQKRQIRPRRIQPPIPDPLTMNMFRRNQMEVSAEGQVGAAARSAAALRLAALFKSQGRTDYIGEPVSIEEMRKHTRASDRERQYPSQVDPQEKKA